MEYKIKKPVRLIELFSGIGAQANAFKYGNRNMEIWKSCDWCVKSMIAYRDIHFGREYEEYLKNNINENLSKEDMCKELYKLGISMDGVVPMDYDQISRMGIKKIKEVYDTIKVTHNLVDIQKANGKDFEIKDVDKYDYVMTYSFPCTDLSTAGKGLGMEKGSGTRSSLIWEVKRILSELIQSGNLPKILIMENVTQVHSKKNINNFNTWIDFLKSIGYSNYYKDMNAKNFGIPQNRNRCFMVSILGDYEYEFPKEEVLELRLKDILLPQEEVEDKYYVSERILKYLERKVKQGWKKEYITDINGCASCICNPGRNQVNDNWIKVNKKIKPVLVGGIGEKKSNNGQQYYQQDRIYDADAIAMCHPANLSGGSYKYKVEEKIRKLTPLECFRLMSFKDEDFLKARNNQSDTALYKMSGDSIVVEVLKKIIDNLY